MKLIQELLQVNEGGMKSVVTDIVDLMLQPFSKERDAEIRELALNIDIPELRRALMRDPTLDKHRGDKDWNRFFNNYELFRTK